MKFVFVYVGIQDRNVFYDFQKRINASVGNDDEVICIPLKPAEVISKTLARSIIETLARKTEEYRITKKQDVAFGVIYITNNNNVNGFIHEIFPTVFLHKVKWKLEGKTVAEKKQSANELYVRAFQATNHSRKALKIVHDEITSRRKVTPLLLPIKNFKSNYLSPALLDLNDRLLQDDIDVVLQSVNDDIRKVHPLTKVDGGNRCFIDDESIEFHAPGSNGLHGQAHPSDDHPAKCLLAGYQRFGAPYEPRFHYDCIRGAKQLKTRMYTCHSSELEYYKGTPHINVAPNDFVRVK